MRVMVLIKSSPVADAEPVPASEGLEAMGRYNGQLAGAGVMLVADELRPSSDGVRVRFEPGRTTVTNGPFHDTADLVAGYWIWQVRSLDEAIEWLKRAPLGIGTEAELRAVADPTDSKATQRAGAAS